LSRLSHSRPSLPVDLRWINTTVQVPDHLETKPPINQVSPRKDNNHRTKSIVDQPSFPNFGNKTSHLTINLRHSAVGFHSSITEIATRNSSLNRGIRDNKKSAVIISPGVFIPLSQNLGVGGSLLSSHRCRGFLIIYHLSYTNHSSQDPTSLSSSLHSYNQSSSPFNIFIFPIPILFIIWFGRSRQTGSITPPARAHAFHSYITSSTFPTHAIREVQREREEAP
jgi:hypothetical protein